MLKKISVFALLLSLWVGMFGAVSVMADTLEHVIDNSTCVFEFNVDENRLYEINTGKYYQLSDDMISKLNEGYKLLVFYTTYSDGAKFSFFAFEGTYRPAVTVYSNSLYLHCVSNDNLNQGLAVCYQESVNFEGSFSVSEQFYQRKTYNNGFLKYYYNGGFYGLLFSTADVFLFELDANYNYVLKDDLYYRAIVKYDFSTWCSDAGLNCAASSNESDSVIPYTYNDYWHIVRRSSLGQWLLTTIGNSKEQQDMQLRISEDEGNFIIYNTFSGDGTDSSVNGYLVHVRQYVYDTDGWKQLSYSTYDFRELSDIVLELEAGTGFDDTKVLAFTNTDIYSYNGYAIMYDSSTEFIDVSDTPIITLSPTPTNAPDSGSSGAGRPGSCTRPEVGGEATGGGGLDFIINLFTLIWQKICSIPMAVDGYSISLQQIFVYGALVSIVGGFIIKFIFRR